MGNTRAPLKTLFSYSLNPSYHSGEVELVHCHTNEKIPSIVTLLQNRSLPGNFLNNEAEKCKLEIRCHFVHLVALLDDIKTRNFYITIIQYIVTAP